MNNLVADNDSRKIRGELDSLLQHKLDKVGDEFLAGNEYIQKWGYDVDDTGTVAPFEAPK